MLGSKIEANETGYKSGMAPGTQLPENYRALSEEAKHSFQRIGDWSRGIPQQRQGAQPSPAPAGNAGGPAVAALSQARDAIARGAPRAAVIERLRQAGIDPSGL